MDFDAYMVRYAGPDGAGFAKDDDGTPLAFAQLGPAAAWMLEAQSIERRHVSWWIEKIRVRGATG